ncbi:hypothetical protein [Nocardioides daejeonensis]|uniref:hypothetical protein n=1 Tax=Nocardioides daejeonensis TaxID=1046556 RepID=UPI000D7497CC|nr:hypothetical protein [Nocardioides daejeonensis]
MHGALSDRAGHPAHDRLGRPVVLLRALVLAAVVLACGAFSHVLADGLLPSTTALAWLWLGTAVVARSFLRRPASRARILALVVGGQAALHLCLSALAGHGVTRSAGTVATPVMETGGNLREQYAARQDALAVAGGHTALDPSALLLHQWQHLVDTGPVMVIAHTAAAVAVALWLASGEQALATLLALSAERVAAAAPRVVHLLALAAALVSAPPRLQGALRRTTAERVSQPHPALVHHVVSHRGPPASLLHPTTIIAR